MNQNSTYDRNRAIAVLTGVVCALISIGGTVLGSIYALQELGSIGLLSVAGFVVADVTMAWASYIDYKEDGTSLEWCAWLVKFVLAAVLILTGAAVTYQMVTEGKWESARKSRTEATRGAQREVDCKGLTPAQCRQALREQRRLGDEVHKRELASDEKTRQEASAAVKDSWLIWYAGLPVFKYVPGLSGLLCLFALTLVAKLAGPGTGPKPSSSSTMRNLGERTYRILPDGRREIIQSTYGDDDVGKILPAEEHRPSIPIRRPSSRPMMGASAGNGKIGQTPPRERLAIVAEKTPEIRAEKLDSEGQKSRHIVYKNAEGLRALREALKVISFRLKGRSFKVDIKPDCVWIRMMFFNGATQQTEASAGASHSILDDVLAMPEEAFRERLERFLRKNGFELEGRQ